MENLERWGELWDQKPDDLDQLEKSYPPMGDQALERALGVIEGQIREFDGEPVPIPKTDDELWELVRKYVGIKIPRTKVCPDHVAPFTAFADAYFARSTTAIWEASRGFGGKSVLLATLGFFETISLGAFVAILGGSTEQSIRVHSYMKGDDPNLPGTFWGCSLAPHYLLRTDPTARETRLLNGGAIKTLAASQKSVRGLHPQRLRVDEIDECELEVLDAAFGQAMEGRGIKEHTVLSSTHHHANGTMTTMKRRAPEKGWKVFTWCYRESMAEPHGWLSEEMVERKKKDITKSMWLNEYENQEPAPRSRAIMPEKVDIMFDKALGEFPGYADEELTFEEPMVYCDNKRSCNYLRENEEQYEEAQFSLEKVKELKKNNMSLAQLCPHCNTRMKKAEYATGADWARKQDWTIIQTWRIDTEPMRMVAWMRTARKSWRAMTDDLDNQIEKYGSNAAHDATGLGDVVEELLRNPVDGIQMVGRKRADMLSDYVGAIENEEIKCPRIMFAYNQHKFAAVDDVQGRGHLPDTISSGAITYIAAGYGGSLAIAL